MRRYVSLRGRREFALTMRRGGLASASAITVHAFAPPARLAGAPKVGVVVTRKVGKAVIRNRVRRRCKHALESIITDGDSRWYVISCRPQSAGASFAELRRQLSGAVAAASRPRRRHA